MLNQEKLSDYKVAAKLSKNKYLSITPHGLLELVERIEFLETRQTELQEEGTKLVTERRELKEALQKRASEKVGLYIEGTEKHNGWIRELKENLGIDKA